ncbi:hypothetical protein ABH945_000691 [Paraburkholderia sp. GAS333]|uniref:integrase n=1 Tax=Paraburkholderia sp. GAS333 TaxID=3156279 RepID=UPI003D23CC33
MTDSRTIQEDTSSDKMHAKDEWRRIADDVVATFDKEGKPKSSFREDCWNLDAYATDARNSNLHFRGHASAESIRRLCNVSKQQWKQVMYLLMYKATDSMPANETLHNKQAVLKHFIRFATQQGITFYQAMSDAKLVIRYILVKGNEKRSIRLHAILVHLHRLGPLVTGVHIPLVQLHEPMLVRANERTEDLQHPVIPTRIYQSFLATCERELEMLEGVAISLEQQLENVYGDRPQSPCPELTQVASYFDCDVRFYLATFVNEIFALCQILVLAFTGMRAKEADTLPYDCLQVSGQNGVDHYVLEGVTTKFSDGRPKRARWITSRTAARAVRLTQRISGVAHRLNGEKSYINSRDGRHLLFCRMGLYSSSEYVSDKVPTNLQAALRNLCKRACTAIRSEDVAELKNIEPHRAWETEAEFSVGNPWPFTKHQLRRTLALYAHRSGLVCLPSLKRQLHHITIEMSRYYARGSAFAKDIVAGHKGHFALEWANSKGLSDYLAYAAQVLFSDERLFGGHATWVSSEAVKQSPVSVFSREKTISMFNKGELAYSETVLGGCASIEECKISPLNFLPIECLEKDCKNLIGSPAKLHRVIATQKKRVEKLSIIDNKSVEYRMEYQTLTTLQAVQKSINEKGNR